jgi:hypothetical protein
MEPGEVPLRLDMPEPRMPKSKRRRPASYQEFLITKLKERPTRPTCCARMLPLRHATIYAVLVACILGECFGLGYFFWRVVLPDSWWIETPDVIETLFTGWMLNTGLFAVWIMLSWLQIMVAIFCCGRGLDIWPTL